MIRVQIKDEVVDWLADELRTTSSAADEFAQELVTLLVQSGGLSQIDAGGIPESVEERLTLAVAIKEDQVRTQNLVCALAATFEDGTRGPLASALNCSTQDANSWARVFEVYGPNAIEAEDKLSAGWWRGALDSDELDRGRANGWSATEMRRAAGLIKEKVAPVIDGGGRVLVNSGSLITVQLDSPLDEDSPDEFRASVRVTRREQ